MHVSGVFRSDIGLHCLQGREVAKSKQYLNNCEHVTTTKNSMQHANVQRPMLTSIDVQLNILLSF
jgi:hypothetical protein